MTLKDILTPERTLCGAPGVSKKRVLESIAEFISPSIDSVDAQEIFSKLIARERLGSTSLGQGIAIPHSRLPSCNAAIGALVSLSHQIDFDAIDEQPVDLLFVLLVPEEANDEHLQILATLAELFSQDDFCNALRQATTSEELYNSAIQFDSEQQD